MNTERYISERAVFTLDEFRASVRSSSSYTMLTRAVRSGDVERVARGVYASRVGVWGQAEVDPFVVATALAPDATLVYHSALEAHDLAQTTWRVVQYESARVRSTVRYRGTEYRCYAPSLPSSDPWHDLAVSTTTVFQHDQGLVRVATRERALVDCLNRIERSGGADEVRNSLAGLPYIDSANVIRYVRALGRPTTAARVGWYLEQHAEALYVPGDALEELHDLLGAGPYYLGTGKVASNYNKRWRLYVGD